MVTASPAQLPSSLKPPVPSKDPKAYTKISASPIQHDDYNYMTLIPANRCEQQEPSNEYLQLINVPNSPPSPSSHSLSGRAKPQPSYHKVSDIT